MNSFLNEKPLLSIVMPSYNSEEYIVEAIKSVISQTIHSWELIIIDDGSKDNTASLVHEFTNKDNRIKFYTNKENQGVSATRNRGISLANGEWIAFLDSDDLWEKEKLEKQIESAKKNKAMFIFTGSSYINESGIKYKGIFEVPEKVTYKQLRKQNVISCSSVLIKKCLLKDIKMERDDMHEDYAFWLRILMTGHIAYGINEPLLVYRISRNSKSGNKLKTFTMTYQVFRFIGLNPISSFYFMMNHVLGSIKKYKKIGQTISG